MKRRLVNVGLALLGPAITVGLVMLVGSLFGTVGTLVLCVVALVVVVATAAAA